MWPIRWKLRRWSRWRIDAIEMTIKLLESCVEGVKVVLKLSLTGTKLLILIKSS
jgi:hypothetical protein